MAKQLLCTTYADKVLLLPVEPKRFAQSVRNALPTTFETENVSEILVNLCSTVQCISPTRQPYGGACDLLCVIEALARRSDLRTHRHPPQSRVEVVWCRMLLGYFDPVVSLVDSSLRVEGFG